MRECYVRHLKQLILKLIIYKTDEVPKISRDSSALLLDILVESLSVYSFGEK